MWPFKKGADKGVLQGRKTVHVNGMKFVIKKINPMLDFDVDSMPQIFTTLSPRLQEKKPVAAKEIQEQSVLDSMKAMIHAGVVEPRLVRIGKGEERGKEDGITVDDLFRDPEIGIKLYMEVLIHSLNHFRGMKGLFFSLKIRHSLYTMLQKVMASVHQQLDSTEKTSP